MLSSASSPEWQGKIENVVFSVGNRNGVGMACGHGGISTVYTDI